MMTTTPSPDLQRDHDDVRRRVSAWFEVLRLERISAARQPARENTVAAAINLLGVLYRAPHRYAKPRLLDDVLTSIVSPSCNLMTARKAARILAGLDAVLLKERKVGPETSTIELVHLPPWPMM